MDNNEKNTGVFINGKAQIAEMLPLLTTEERTRLLANIRTRNKPLADELQAESISIYSMMDLDDKGIQTILRYVQAPIMGIALKALSITEKKRILAIADREYAELAFQAMRASLNDETKGVKSATDKVKRTMVALMQKNVIHLQ